MANPPEPFISTVVWNGSACVIMARIVNVANVAITQSSVTVVRKIQLIADGTATDYDAGTTLVPADVIFNTLQTDYGWNVDDSGYNFREVQILTTLGKYRIEYTFTDLDLIPVKFVCDIDVAATL